MKTTLSMICLLWSLRALGDDLQLVIYAEVTSPDSSADQLHLYWRDCEDATLYTVLGMSSRYGTATVLGKVFPDSAHEWIDTTLQTEEYYYVVGTRESKSCVSDTVGYFKVDIEGGTSQQPSSTHFSLPGFYYFEVPSSNIPNYVSLPQDTMAEHVLDEQLICTTGFPSGVNRLVLMASTTNRRYRNINSSCNWSAPGWYKWYNDQGFAFVNKTASRHILLAGTTNLPSALKYTDSLIVPDNGYAYVGFPILECTDFADLGLLEDGFDGGSTFAQSDFIRDIESGDTAWYDTDIEQWVGSIAEACPTRLYSVWARGIGFTYIYP